MVLRSHKDDVKDTEPIGVPMVCRRELIIFSEGSSRAPTGSTTIVVA